MISCPATKNISPAFPPKTSGAVDRQFFLVPNHRRRLPRVHCENRKMGIKPLATENVTFEGAFQEMKLKEYQLQKSLVDAVMLENYSQADSIKRELNSTVPECSTDIINRLERGRGKFVGQCFQHKKYGYRGVIFKADPQCKMDEAWVQMMGVRRLPMGSDQPFYHCLVDMRDRPGGQTTYVAEENIEMSEAAFPVQHPLLQTFFTEVPRLKCFIGKDTLEILLEGYDS